MELAAAGAAQVLGPDHGVTKALVRAAQTMDKADLWRARLGPSIDTARAEVCNAAMKRVTAFAVLLVVLAAPAWAGWDEGIAAYDRGYYARVVKKLGRAVGTSSLWFESTAAGTWCRGLRIYSDPSRVGPIRDQ